MRNLLLASLLLAACGTTTQFASTNPSPRPLASRPASTVAVFTTTQPDRPFVEVGLIKAQQSSDLSNDDMPDIIAELRREAGRRGCDGVIIAGAADRTVPSAFVGGSSSTLEGYLATCIVYTDVGPAVAAQP